MSIEDHSGRVAVITGASSGIGEATARALAATGHRLALLARRADRIQALATELGNGAIAIAADVTDRDALVAAAERVTSELGGADILINSAGVMLLAPFSADQRAESRQMVEVNLLGAMTATEVFLDQLRNGEGDLVNISSVAGRTARPGNAVYAATKWGINGWSEALRQELQPGVRVTVIEPGAVATDPRRLQADGRGLLRAGRDHRPRHRRDHRLRDHPTAPRRPQRDPDPTHSTGVARRTIHA
jgi:NADP-dependent 3-hydroxy acid dehydrogenase YdfG